MGFMGSGKSTVGRILSEILGNTGFIDLDTYIESAENQSIAKIFDTHGEDYFRSLENTYLKKIIKTEDKVVVALGGGTPCFNDNVSLISPYSSFYLKVGVARLANRLYDPATQRPLLKGLTRAQLSKYIASKVREREVYYVQAQSTIRAYGKPESVAKQIVEKL